MKRSLFTLLVSAPLMGFVAGVAAAQPPAADSQSNKSVAPDNTKSNSQDPSNRTRTADDQKNTGSDLEITRRIRRSVMDDKSLSTNARNAKIVSVNGTVTLNGVVKDPQEKSNIERIATQVVGSDHVVNNIKIEGR